MERLAHILSDEEIDRHRRDDCTHYDDCLEVACIERWASFSCLNCWQYKPTAEPYRPYVGTAGPTYPEGLRHDAGIGRNGPLGVRLRRVVDKQKKEGRL